MKVDFAGRGIDITDRIRSFTESKLDRLTKHLDELQDVGVVLSVEKYRHRAEIKFNSLRRNFHGTEETNDMFQSIDRVVDNLEAQVRKFKQKTTAKRRNMPQNHKHNDPPIEPMDDLPEHKEAEAHVIRTDHVELYNLEEAVDELENEKLGFVIYRDSESAKINVVYRRRDGNIGLIDPRNP
jgi:putative sigma-54 modulation protein